MGLINKYLRNFKPYKLASHKVWNVSREERKQILKLDWNESVVPPSPMVVARINHLVEMGDFYNLYPATSNEDLLKKISEYTGMKEENIQYFGSSDSLHEYIAKMYISVGDPVLILGPSYDNFRLTAEVNGARVFFYEYNEDFSFSEDGFEKYIDSIEPSLVYICNPNNPTGYLHPVYYIETLLKKYPNIVFLIDEAYSEFSGESAKELVLQYENILISRTMSKAFSIANFRIGYLISAKVNIDYISSIRNPKNITTFAQEAAIGALSDIEYMKNYVSEVLEARNYFMNELKNMPDYFSVYNSAGNFVLVKCRTYEMKRDLLEYLEKNNIFVRDTSHSPVVRNCIRVTMGKKKHIERVICVMKEFLQDYKNLEE